MEVTGYENLVAAGKEVEQHGAGVGSGFPGLSLGFGVGAGCGIGIGFGHGFGKGVAYDENGRYSNIGRSNQRSKGTPSE
ncbi:unnamed protein product [Miscanthus lutarioriparius]|uniref:Glycine-rich protein n=1 Tax=Miscanthus lutarioriparius TaxID=422564 RepID=A0A811RNK2_9POAL|nr:unnamed protein product [Miscanthus lutarioriparius]